MTQTAQQRIEKLTMPQVDKAIEDAKKFYTGIFKSRPQKRVEKAKLALALALADDSLNPQALLLLILMGEGNKDTWSFKNQLVNEVLSGTKEMAHGSWPWMPAEERIALFIPMLRELITASAQAPNKPAKKLQN